MARERIPACISPNILLLNADAISRVAVEDDRFAGRRERERESERRIEKYRDQNSIVK